MARPVTGPSLTGGQDPDPKKSRQESEGVCQEDMQAWKDPHPDAEVAMLRSTCSLNVTG